MPDDIMEQLNEVKLYMWGLEALVEAGKVIVYRLAGDDEPSVISAEQAEHVHRVNAISIGELRQWHDQRLEEITRRLREEGANHVS